jgi:hypothetical protein
MNTMEAPFKIGERIHPDQLIAWEYVGLTGKPGQDKHAVRSFKKGDWRLEVRAHRSPRAMSRVVSIRTLAEDDKHWTETRMRLMRHKRKYR